MGPASPWSPVLRGAEPATSLVATAAPAEVSTTNNSVEQEYKAIMTADDAAQDEVTRMIQENEAFAAKGAALPEAELRRRSRERLESVRKSYEDFLQRHPDHVRAQIAYAAFLNDLGEESTAQEHLERALTLNPKDPAIYNNLANVYGQVGSPKKAFECFAKAIELSPSEPVYYHNFGKAVFLFQKDAQDFFHLQTGEAMQKALDLYSNAMRLDPDDFPLASDAAQTYYGIRPFPIDASLKSWTNALLRARDEVEREGVQVHFARIKTLAGRFSEAQAHIDAITNETYAELRKGLKRNLDELLRAAEKLGTNAPVGPTVGTAVPSPAGDKGTAPQ